MPGTAVLFDDGMPTLPYADADTYRAASTLVQSERMQDHAIILPLFHEMTGEDQQRVVDGLRSVL